MPGDLVPAPRDSGGAGMRVLCTGAGGFIGGHLVKALLDRGDEVRAVDVKPLAGWQQVHEGAENRGDWDLRSAALTASAPRDCDLVFALAADMGGMGFISASHVTIVRNNALITSTRSTPARDGRPCRGALHVVGVRLPRAHAARDRHRADCASRATPGRAAGWPTGGRSCSPSCCAGTSPASSTWRRASPGSTTSTGRSAPTTAGARSRRPQCAARSRSPRTAARSRCGATASRRDRSATSTTASKASTGSCTRTSTSP